MADPLLVRLHFFRATELAGEKWNAVGTEKYCTVNRSLFVLEGNHKLGAMEQQKGRKFEGSDRQTRAENY